VKKATTPEARSPSPTQTWIAANTNAAHAMPRNANVLLCRR
jgi:hypothetical protein